MISFAKYQGAGNDFILIDDRMETFDRQVISKICHRKFGIGADGVILLQEAPPPAFRMRIFNADGSEAESCGNGLRCFIQFLHDLGISQEKYSIAIGGSIVTGWFENGHIAIQMGKKQVPEKLRAEGSDLFFLDTGVPHAVLFSKADFAIAPKIREQLAANVNFAEVQADQSIRVRTYEKGVEGETFACGTGAIAVATVAKSIYDLPSPIRIRFIGGSLDICFDGEDVTMVGDAEKVFEGSLESSIL